MLRFILCHLTVLAICIGKPADGISHDVNARARVINAGAEPEQWSLSV